MLFQGQNMRKKKYMKKKNFFVAVWRIKQKFMVLIWNNGKYVFDFNI